MVQNTEFDNPQTNEEQLAQILRDKLHQAWKEKMDVQIGASMDAWTLYEQQIEAARIANIEMLAQNKAVEITALQGKILEDMVSDISTKGNSTAKKEYVSKTYGKDVAPGVASNYCLVVQIESLNLANKELGKQVSNELAKLGEELNSDNILKIKTQSKRVDGELLPGVADTLSLGSNFRNRDFMNQYANSAYMDNVRVNPEVARTGYANFRTGNGQVCSHDCKLENNSVSLSSYVDNNGYVRKDENGNPRLKDGDFAFVQTNHGNENSSGFHAIRLNVDENGKVTYTAGNTERINEPLGAAFMTCPCAVFHTQDYITDCVKEEYNDLNYQQAHALASGLYPEQTTSVDYEAIKQECYDKRMQEMMQDNQQRKEEAVRSVQQPQLTPQEKLRALQMGKTVAQASQATSNQNANQSDTHRRGFNIANFSQIQSRYVGIGY